MKSQNKEVLSGKPSSNVLYVPYPNRFLQSTSQHKKEEELDFKSLTNELNIEMSSIKKGTKAWADDDNEERDQDVSELTFSRTLLIFLN
jgi:hypothetical protein